MTICSAGAVTRSWRIVDSRFDDFDAAPVFALRLQPYLDVLRRHEIGKAFAPFHQCDGFPVENAAGRYGFRSSEILRGADSGFSIFVSASAHAGNWLPIGAPAPFALVLRLYDSPLSATAGGIEKSAAPSIVREGCA